MPTITELKEERAGLIQNARKLLDKAESEKRDLNAEESAQYDTMFADAQGIASRVERLEQQEEAERTLVASRDVADLRDTPASITSQADREAGITDQDRTNAFLGWARYQQGLDPDDTQLDAAKKCGVSLRRNEFNYNLSNRSFSQIKAAQSTGTTTAGGFTVPEGFVASLEAAMLHYGPMMQVSNILRTSDGRDLPMPTMNDTSQSGALLAENAQVSAQDITFGSLTLEAYKYTSKLVLVSHELLTDSALDIPGIIGTALGERLGRALNTVATTGDGSSKPKGIVACSTEGKEAASATAITFDEIIDLIHSVDIAYRSGARFMMHDTVAATISKLKDGDNNYLWVPSVREGESDRLRNYPVSINNDMSSTITADDITILFGDFSKFIIRMVNSVRLVHMKERYADYDQEGFVAFMRWDSDLLNAGTNPVKHLAQPSS